MDVAELRALLYYANLFHHDSNPAWSTQIINDQALVNFAAPAGFYQTVGTTSFAEAEEDDVRSLANAS